MKASVVIILSIITVVATWQVLKFIDGRNNPSTNLSINSGLDSTDIYNRKGALPDIGLPSDYFPTKVGTRWVYNITGISTNNYPLRHQISSWPTIGQGGKTKCVESRGIIYRWSGEDDNSDGKNKLILQIEGVAEKQGPMQRPEGYKIKIEKDDLGIYENNTGVFWAISKHGRYEVIEVVTLDPNSSSSLGGGGGAWGSMNDADGYSQRFILFGEKPMIAIGFASDKDSLLFVGVEKLDGVQCLHFRRMVEKSKERINQKGTKDPPSYFDSSFTEDVWYGKGIGLMKLIQKVEGKVTMTWTLER